METSAAFGYTRLRTGVLSDMGLFEVDAVATKCATGIRMCPGRAEMPDLLSDAKFRLCGERYANSGNTGGRGDR
jgi:hypothetical protein